MKQLFTPKEYTLAKSNDKLPCECYQCAKVFYKDKRTINKVLKKCDGHTGQFCSNNCKVYYNGTIKLVKCKNCTITFSKQLSQIKKSKNNFCSKSCAATYNNKNKKHGTRRSKLEIYIEEQLINIYPYLNFDFNKKDTIGSELDIYIPSLNLAIELNGIFHYEPIYGIDKLQKIQKNDKSKSKACHDLKIDFCIIDTSGQKYFKPKSSQKFLNIITSIINERLLYS